MKFSWEWIKELSDTTLTPQVAADLFTAKSFEVKEVSDDILDIDILPNRPDCLSHIGIARELCALEERQFVAPEYEYNISEHSFVEIDVQDPEGCIRFSALIIKGVKVRPSPEWLVRRLELLGLRSINNVVDATNLVMLELGQPMHAFDLAKVGHLVVRRARSGETVRALDEARTEYTLDESILVVADANKPLSIAGIKGGADSGISDDTTDVLLEAACWKPEAIRVASKKLGLKTDASMRFSYGTDPNLTAPALICAADLLARIADGQASGGIIDKYQSPMMSQVIALPDNAISELLGMNVQKERVEEILTNLGCEVKERPNGGLLVHIPTRRLDINGPEDLAEEVGRIIGYDKIPSKAPIVFSYDERSELREDSVNCAWDEYSFIRERNSISSLLVGAGYTEIYSYAFLSDFLKDLFAGDSYELAQPRSSEYKWLCRSLVPRMLVNARDNLRFNDSVKIFETGHVFIPELAKGKEPSRIGLVSVSRTVKPADLFAELKGVIDLILERAGIAGSFYDDAGPFLWDEGIVKSTTPKKLAMIRIETGEAIGFIGVVSPRVVDALKLKSNAVIAELDLRMLISSAQKEREFEPLPKYPSVIRDIAVLVPADTKIGDIMKIAQSADTEKLVRDIDVFDIFDGSDGKKSVAFHVLMRADDRTLTDEDANKVETEIKKILQEKLGAQAR